VIWLTTGFEPEMLHLQFHVCTRIPLCESL
jgi:hypothetical protein